VRRIPLPQDPARVAAWAATLGRSRLGDELALERIGAAPGSARDAALREAMAAASGGRVGPSLAIAAAFLRGASGGVDDLADLFEASLRPEADLAAFARQAFDRIASRELLRGRGGAVADVELALASRHPDLPQLRLDAAITRLLAGEIDGADALLAQTADGERGALSTAALERRGIAEIGRAWVALLRGDAEAAQLALALARRFGRPLLAQEDPLSVVELRAAFVGAVAQAVAGTAPRDGLRRALESSPIDVERCFVDAAWFGPLGPGAMPSSLLAGSGGGDLRGARQRATIELGEAIEATCDRHGHGLLSTSPEEGDDGDHERLVSWTFLGAAERKLTEDGDPAAALAYLAPRLGKLARRRLWANQELLVEARLLEARCHVYAGDEAAAAAAHDGALALALALQASAGHEYVHRVALDETPPPPSGALIFRSEPPYASLVGRVHAARASRLATMRGDARAAALELFEAGACWPWDQERWLRCALDLARRGRDDEARRCLACVEASPDHAYDRACVFAQLGDSSEAFALLQEHLDWGARTPAGRALELSQMRRDRDLAPLRDDPRFPRE
jgi:hypothetical protein